MPVVNREVVLPVPRERAWELITEPSELEGWLADEVEFEPYEDSPLRVTERRRDARGRRRGGRRFGADRLPLGRLARRMGARGPSGGTRFVVTEHRFAADTVTWGPKLLALSGASMLCPA